MCESNGEIQGFIGLNGDYIEGIFVCDRLQSQGIGKLFAGFCKGKQNAIKFKCVSEKHKSDTFLSERRI